MEIRDFITTSAIFFRNEFKSILKYLRNQDKEELLNITSIFTLLQTYKPSVLCMFFFFYILLRK